MIGSRGNEGTMTGMGGSNAVDATELGTGDGVLVAATLGLLDASPMANLALSLSSSVSAGLLEVSAVRDDAAPDGGNSLSSRRLGEGSRVGLPSAPGVFCTARDLRMLERADSARYAGLVVPGAAPPFLLL